ncbi:hypothetical protein [Streptomyces chromofuscus]|uniref:Uncharacterized protein n=1 Tax=Streptomyces chromofuscus TaxID=42881 RepID=A0A7M2T812_STRCW|nr:hypothetical protein [Streptomyces chromofuscus]QOV44043.1 hypothetical protein IPT68_30995 [Streptomyces chromofuscus]
MIATAPRTTARRRAAHDSARRRRAPQHGLVYDDTAFTAYACGIWVMSRRQVTLPPGASFTLRRRIVAVDNQGSTDPFAVLDRL